MHLVMSLVLILQIKKNVHTILEQYESDKKVLSEEGYVIIDYNEWKKVNILQELELDYYSINKLEL